MEKGAHLTPEGLSEIVNIKSGISKGRMENEVSIAR